jgi:glycosyltransferase involved in cell wall biosynthesis
VIAVRFLDAEGAILDPACEGLSISEGTRLGRYFYPLQILKRGAFSKEFSIDAPVAMLEIEILLWRPQTPAKYTLEDLKFLSTRFDRRFADLPETLPEGSSYAWALSEIAAASREVGLAALDIAAHGDQAHVTTRHLVQALLPDGRVDCVRIAQELRPDFRIFTPGAQVLAGDLGQLPRQRQYHLISLYPHVYNWSTIASALEDIESLLGDSGYLVVGLASNLSGEPEHFRKQLQSQSGSTELSLHTASEILKESPFEPVGLVAAIDREHDLDPIQWMIVRKKRVFLSVRDTPGLVDTIARSAWADAAVALEPILRKSTSHSQLAAYLGQYADQFAETAKVAGKQGRQVAVLPCRMAAAMLKPESEAYSVELLSALRSAGEYEFAERFCQAALKRFPGSWSLRMQEALLQAATDRGLEASFTVMEYIRAMPRFNASMRRSITVVMRGFAHQCQRADVVTSHPQPLLLPEVALAYNADVEKNAQRWYESPLTKLLAFDNIQRAAERSAARAARRVHEQADPGRRTRILFISGGNWKLVINILKYFENHDTGFDFRTYDFSSTEESLAKDHLHEIFAPVSLGLDPNEVWRRTVESDATFGDLVEWSHLVFCEWAGSHAIWLSRFLPADKRLLIRLHSYEAFSQWPFFLNYGGVDGMLFVAGHIRSFADKQFRMLEHGFPTAVLPNFNDMSSYARPKAPSARRTLGMVGYSNMNKDPIFAVRVLEHLLRSDASWRLKLVGHTWNEAALDGDELAYFREFKALVAEHKLEDAIIFSGYSKDIPAVLEDVGFILSCSWREGTHEALLEGMATGAVPVLRRWPMVSPFGAPESTYPGLECFETVDQAVEIVTAHAGEKEFGEASRKAIAYAMENFDETAVFPRFAEFLNLVADRTGIDEGSRNA